MNILNYISNKIRMDKNNKLIIAKTSSLKGCNIRIRGENNFVEFKENTSFRNPHCIIKCNQAKNKNAS